MISRYKYKELLKIYEKSIVAVPTFECVFNWVHSKKELESIRLAQEDADAKYLSLLCKQLNKCKNNKSKKEFLKDLLESFEEE